MPQKVSILAIAYVDGLLSVWQATLGELSSCQSTDALREAEPLDLSELTQLVSTLIIQQGTDARQNKTISTQPIRPKGSTAMP